MSKIIRVESCEECKHYKEPEYESIGSCYRIAKTIFTPLNIHPDCPLDSTEDIRDKCAEVVEEIANREYHPARATVQKECAEAIRKLEV